MSIPAFLSDIFKITTESPSPIEFLFLNTLYRDPTQVCIDLLLRYTHQAISCIVKARKLLHVKHTSVPKYLAQQVEDLCLTTYNFMKRLLESQVTNDSTDIQKRKVTFYVGSNVISADRQSFLSLFEVSTSSEDHILAIRDFFSSASAESGVKAAQDIGHQIKEQKYHTCFVELCFLSLLIGVKVDDPMFERLFGNLPMTVLFHFYSLLVIESQKEGSCKAFQSRFSLYADHLASRLQKMEMEVLDKVVKESNVSEAKVDKAVSCAISVDSQPSFQREKAQIDNSQEIKTIEARKMVKDDEDVFLSFDQLKSMKEGDRLDVKDQDGVWCNAEVHKVIDTDVVIHFLYWESFHDLKLTSADTLGKRVAFPGTKARDHLLHKSRVAKDFSSTLPNIIERDTDLARVFEGLLVHPCTRSDGQRYKLDMNTFTSSSVAMHDHVHAQVDVFRDGKLFFHGCIESVNFQQHRYFFVLGLSPANKVRHFLLLAENDNKFDLPNGFSARRPENIVLWTEHHMQSK